MQGLTEELVQKIGNLAASLGLNRVAGQLYILLFLSPKPLCLDEMVAALRVSKGHVSTNIRALERWQAVKRIWVKGSRKDYYEANPNTPRIIAGQLKQGLTQRFEELEKIIASAKDKLALKNTRGSDVELKNLQYKVKQIEKMHKQISGLLEKLNFLSIFK